ncbi:YdiU family protein [cf. Phormidesmis sp. LEGE 11477]|uniref:protein adenylyltransferase SelO n=1 Tax=cf. Phormidesmis sp. LEGE 11477 TaxID=1828680 RepID=UPI00188176BB|nr:YdiU family protein [cf. Phormidesmis sp. LEGE 11477]MBE9061677.1 YdiU family protein [cf. Phormidesmis sp. LEGE 11477]
MASNPLLTLSYEPAFASLGPDYYDEVTPATFPKHILRFRNDALLPKVGLSVEEVSDRDFIEAFGQFQSKQTDHYSAFLALRYHGYQFRSYNPFIGDGRGFLHGQVRGIDGRLYDFGTKGSGPTPYSRGGDGRLTLKGGIREILASEALHALGVNTSRTLSLIETGESLHRGDEPSPTRSSVMVRFSHSHIRFGTFERLHYIKRPDLAKNLLDHVIEIYYPHLLTVAAEQDRYGQWFAELAERLATLVAQWMAAGFCHAVLNTDNMSITGESFDYGPFAFMEEYDPRFTAAYFDYSGLYCYGNQPGACYWNLEKLAVALDGVVDSANLEAGLAQYQPKYAEVYCDRLLQKLGFATDIASQLSPTAVRDLVSQTLTLLETTRVGYHDFFLTLTEQFTSHWQTDPEHILSSTLENSDPQAAEQLKQWRSLYQHTLSQLPPEAMTSVQECLRETNPKTVLHRPKIEAVWAPITEEDNWQPFYELLKGVQNSMV